MQRFKKLPLDVKRRVILRYALFQIPDLGALVAILLLLKWWLGLSPQLAWGLTVLWLLKEIALFPFLWPACEPYPESGSHLIGAAGIAEERLAPTGYVRVEGELWRAKAMEEEAPIDKGEQITVQGVSGLTLLVRRGVRS